MSAHPFREMRYLLSAHHLNQLPADFGREVAFAGRSNAGKSSALNAITDQTRLARVSKTPGRTQQINFFVLGENTSQRLVDLPGYGYAEVPAALREHWRAIIDRYLRTRNALVGLILIIDCRHPLKEFDQLMLKFCADIGLPCHCLLTKADKLSRNQAMQSLTAVQRELTQQYSGASAQLFSALAKSGLDEVRTKLADWLQLNGESRRNPAEKL